MGLAGLPGDLIVLAFAIGLWVGYVVERLGGL